MYTHGSNAKPIKMHSTQKEGPAGHLQRRTHATVGITESLVTDTFSHNNNKPVNSPLSRKFLVETDVILFLPGQ